MKSNPDILRQRKAKETVLMKVREKAYAERRRNLITAASTLLLGLAGSIASFTAFSSLMSKRGGLQSDALLAEQRIAAVESDLKTMKHEFEQSKRTIEAIRTPVQESAIAVKLAETKEKLESFSGRLAQLEAALLDTPEKALSIPLMRKDLAELDRRTLEHRSAAQSEFARLYSQQTWILGGIGTALFGLASGSLAILIKSLPKTKE